MMTCLSQFVCLCVLAVIGRTQELQSCSDDAIPSTVGSTEDADALATSILACQDGNFAVQWVGEVFVEETINVTGSTSLNITGAGPGAIADGGSSTQLFYVDEGSILHLSDLTLANGNAATGDGGAISVSRSTVSFSGNMSFISNSAADNGGAIFAHSSTVSWDGNGNQFISNSAGSAYNGHGGAIYAYDSNLSWDGDSTNFSNNSAGSLGGAISVQYSNVSWNGDNTQFIFNSAGLSGGAIHAYSANVSWNGDGTQLSNNSAGDFGGAICVSWSSTASWYGDSTEFSNNSADDNGGAIYVTSSLSMVSWNGASTEFSNNSAGDDGGAIYLTSSTVSWDGGGTAFTSNSAGVEGGAIYATSSSMFLDQNTIFSSNVAGENGGALAVSNLEDPDEVGPFNGTALIDNSAGTAGAAIYLSNCDTSITFINATFKSNWASGAGGAVAAFATDEISFWGCTFLNNTADGTGGAVETLAGYQSFISCEFVGNSADVGGALRLGGTASVVHCSFFSNSATSRGLAVAVVASAVIGGSSFDGNELYCDVGSYREDTEEEGATSRFDTVCFDCPDWDTCLDCSIERGNITSTCAAPLAHTTASEPGVTLETLSIDGGYWRVTSTSDQILACFNAAACSGGVTGAENYCASGYTGPYCAVCETGFSASPGHTCTRCSSSRRQGLIAATVIAAVVAAVSVVAVFKLLSSTEVEERKMGWLNRKVLRAVPVQALKIVVVVWQILTQFADAVNVTYPGVAQEFLNVIDFINFDVGSVIAAGCLWPDIDFHDRLVVSTVGPLVVIGFLAMTYRMAVRRSGTTSGNNAVAEKIFHRHLTAVLLLTFLVYSSVSSIVFQTFACETLDDGTEYLRADYRIHCTDAKHRAFEVYAGIMVCVYPVGIPLLYAVLLFQRRDVLGRASADKTKAQSISGLWEPYTSERFYYEVVECGRRIMLTGVVVFIFPNDAAQIAITMLIAFFFVVVFEVLSPYKSESDTWLSRGGHVLVFLSMFDSLLLKVDVSGERDQSQAAFGGVLVAGHVLMVAVIVVEVVGICIASGKENSAVDVGSESPSGLRPREGLDDVPVFTSAPTSWVSFMRRESVSEVVGPARGVSGTAATTVGRP